MKTCTQCGTGFEVPKQRGRPATKCPDCRTVKQTVTQFSLAEPTLIQSAEPCRGCGQVFSRPKQRGKPPVRCQPCKDSIAANLAVPQETLEEAFKGDKDLLKGTPDSLPKGGEAQCPLSGCGRIFTSDSGAESHKYYSTLGKAFCKDPATLGMVPIERRGLPIWRKPTDEAGRDKLKALK